MGPRLVTSLIIGAIALAVTVIGLVDPLEGGMALLFAVGLGVVVRLVSGVPVPRLAWLSMLVTMGVGALVLVLAVAGASSEVVQDVGPEVTAPNPLSAGARILVWIYRLGVLFVIAGEVAYLVRIVKALRGGGEAREEASTA